MEFVSEEQRQSKLIHDSGEETKEIQITAITTSESRPGRQYNSETNDDSALDHQDKQMINTAGNDRKIIDIQTKYNTYGGRGDGQAAVNDSE